MSAHVLQLYLGTLFLFTYELPTVKSVKKIIKQAKGLKNRVPFEIAVRTLLELIDNLQNRKAELIFFSKSSFLGMFAQRSLDYVLFPYSKKRSTHDFFEKFFVNLYFPKSAEDFQDLILWCQFVVQFEEGNEKRICEAMEFLEKLKQSLIADCDLNDDDDDDDVENENVKNENVTKKKTPQVLPLTEFCKKFEDTKFCECVEYEASGDCGCLLDI